MSDINNLSAIDKLLNDRRKEHGDFDKNAKLFRRFMNAFAEETDMSKITDSMFLGITMVFQKLCRASQKPTTVDHYRDMAGYSILIQKSVEANKYEIYDTQIRGVPIRIIKTRVSAVILPLLQKAGKDGFSRVIINGMKYEYFGSGQWIDTKIRELVK